MIEVSKLPVRATLLRGDMEHLIRLLELHGHTDRTAKLAINLRGQLDQSTRDHKRVWGNDAA